MQGQDDLVQVKIFSKPRFPKVSCNREPGVSGTWSVERHHFIKSPFMLVLKILPELTEVPTTEEKTIQNPQSPPNSCPVLPIKHSSHLREDT